MCVPTRFPLLGRMPAVIMFLSKEKGWRMETYRFDFPRQSLICGLFNPANPTFRMYDGRFTFHNRKKRKKWFRNKVCKLFFTVNAKRALHKQLIELVLAVVFSNIS